MGEHNEYSLDHYNWICGGGDRKIPSSRKQVRAQGVHLLQTLLGIVGAFVATYLGQAIGWYQAGQGAGFIGAIVGAIIVLVVWGLIAPRLERT